MNLSLADVAPTQLRTFIHSTGNYWKPVSIRPCSKSIPALVERVLVEKIGGNQENIYGFQRLMRIVWGHVFGLGDRGSVLRRWHLSWDLNDGGESGWEGCADRGNCGCKVSEVGNWLGWRNWRRSQGTMVKMRLLLLSHFSRVRLCVTPETVAHQAPPSLGFSRQEHWSGLPFPSPMHESEKWKESRSVVSDSEPSHGLQPTRLLHPWDFPGKSTGVGCHCLLPRWD